MSARAIDKAAAAWGSDMPLWVRTLAEECDKTSQAQVARRLGNSTSVVSRVLAKSYPGDRKKIEAKVRGHYLAEEVHCPVLETIPRQRCIAEQEMGLSFQNPLRRRVYDACRSGCKHYRKAGSR